MVSSRFRRTLSFPVPITNRPTPVEKSYHIRSVSLPCRSHPLLSQLNDEINDLKTWQSTPTHLRNSSWLCDGLISLKNLHNSFDDLLQLPKTQESLRRRSDWVEKLLEEFLQFADVYGIFRASLVDMKEEQSSAQVAIRRRDELTIVSYLKIQKKITKEIKKLVSSVKCSVSSSSSSSSSDSMLTFDEDAELAGILRDVIEMTASVTVAILNSISGSSLKSKSCIGTNFLKKRNQSNSEGRIQEFEEIQADELKNLRKQGDKEVRSLLKKMQTLENCVAEIEIESGKMFRNLINTRVSLLNVLTK